MTATTTRDASTMPPVILVRAVGLVVAFIALIVSTSPSASARTRSADDPAPVGTTSAQLPVNLTLGPVRVSVAVPLDAGALLGRIAPTTPDSAKRTAGLLPVRTAPHPVAKPRSRATPAQPVERTTPEQRRPIATTRPVAHSQDVPPATASARPPTPTRSGTVAQGPVEALQQALRPGSPILLLLLVVLGCGAGTAVVVGAAGHRPRHRPGGTASG